MVLGTQGTLATPRRMSPYPSPNASPRVRYTGLELDSDPTLGNGEWDYYYRFRYGDE